VHADSVTCVNVNMGVHYLDVVRAVEAVDRNAETHAHLNMHVDVVADSANAH